MMLPPTTCPRQRELVHRVLAGLFQAAGEVTSEPHAPNTPTKEWLETVADEADAIGIETLRDAAYLVISVITSRHGDRELAQHALDVLELVCHNERRRADGAFAADLGSVIVALRGRLEDLGHPDLDCGQEAPPCRSRL